MMPWLWWRGRVEEMCAYAEKVSASLDVVVEESGGPPTGPGMDAYRGGMQNWHLVGTVVELMCDVGLRHRAAPWLRKLGLYDSQAGDKRSSEQFSGHWRDALDPAFADKEFLVTMVGTMTLWSKARKQTEDYKKKVLAILNGTDTSQPSGPDALNAIYCRTREFFCFLYHGPLTTCALLAEQWGELELAERYAQLLLDRGCHEFHVSQMLAMLARLEIVRSGDRAVALEHWRKAAAVAMDARWHLYALFIGWQCGGAEGSAIADAACAAMGRAESVVRAELEAAGAVIPQPPRPALAVGTAASSADMGNVSAPSTPRRKLDEAKAQDAALNG